MLQINRQNELLSHTDMAAQAWKTEERKKERKKERKEDWHKQTWKI